MSGQSASMAILIIDDEDSFLESCSFILSGIEGVVVHTCQDPKDAVRFVQDLAIELVLLDINMPGIRGDELLPRLIEQNPQLAVIMVSAINEVEKAVECMKAGARDYLVKPLNAERLTHAVGQVLELWNVREENRRLKETLLTGKLANPEHFSHIITQNPEMFAVLQYIESISKSALPVLITGETGSGKELAAQAVHKSSGRRGEFVALNVAASDSQLFSDTLFGHEKGAFTGADKKRPGLIEKAKCGTLFLDEIGDLSIDLQIRLLRLLQEKKYYPLGSDSPRETDARVVVATHCDLPELVEKGSFRRDLYYRLQYHQINLPPLRKRTEDIPILFYRFFEQALLDTGKSTPAIPQELFSLLGNYRFPGNIRELQAMVYEAVSRHAGATLSLETFRQRTSIGTEQTACSSDQVQLPFPEILPPLESVEPLFIAEALRRTKGNQTQAAALLGISRKALNNRLHRKTE